MNPRINIPQHVLDKHRPNSLVVADRIDMSERPLRTVQLYSGAISVDYIAHMFECGAHKHHFRKWFAEVSETIPEVTQCPRCGSDAQALTLKYQWERLDSQDFCRGCGVIWNRAKQSAAHKANCPYEKLKPRSHA